MNKRSKKDNITGLTTTAALWNVNIQPLCRASMVSGNLSDGGQCESYEARRGCVLTVRHGTPCPNLNHDG